MNKNSIELALEIALAAHSGQVDKAGKPYILHPMRVATYMKTEECIITALLHDVVEDTEVTIETLALSFSPEIIEALKLLTHEKGTDYFTYIHNLKGNKLARAVKITDLLHNSDLSRLEEITQKDLDRYAKYKKALAILCSEDRGKSQKEY